MKIAFVIGSPDIGGGTNVIFNHALYAKKHGWDVTIIVTLPSDVAFSSHWHPALSQLHFLSMEMAQKISFDLAIATWWPTVYVLPKITARQYMYFIQSIESWFVPDNNIVTRQEIDATYLPPIPVITEAQWIQRYLKEQFNKDSFLVLNGIDKKEFSLLISPIAPLKKDGLRVLVEGPISVDFKNVPRTIKLVQKAKPGEIWLLTSSDIAWYPGVDKVFSRLSISDVAAVYASCDVLVKLSYVEGMFGPPLEIFHCGGTAITYDVTGYDEYMVHGENSMIVPTGNEAAVVHTLEYMKRDGGLLNTLKQGAVRTAESWPSWDSSSKIFMESMEKILSLPPVSSQKIKDMLAKGAPEIIPVFRSSRVKNKIKQVLKNKFPRLSSAAKRVLVPLWCAYRLSNMRDRGIRSKTCSLPKPLFFDGENN